MTRRLLEVETAEAFDTHVAHAERLNGWFVQSVDLSSRTEALNGVDPRGAVFLGCTFAPGVEERLRRAGALVFPRLPDLPFDPYRGGLYDPAELYGSADNASSPDAEIYAWSRTGDQRALVDDLATTLHDHAITDALDDATERLDPRHLVGVMGGHALRRDEPVYAAAAQLGAALTAAGRTVLTGGGPGAMEAANLGAYLSPWPGALEEALRVLSSTPSYRPSIDAWLRSARSIHDRWPVTGSGGADGVKPGRSIAIPTWFYGHEPTNVYATLVAKYFTNALREDTLLHRCRGGIVYLPGRAGTVQELFQAATENSTPPDPIRWRR